jgi:predicted nucleic acid-binding protein
VRIYFDSSALVKRGLDEPESAAMQAAIDRYLEHGAHLLTSTLAAVETSRALRSTREAQPPVEVAEAVSLALSGIIQHPISEHVIGIARRLGPSSLRSLDAIHLATAAALDADVVCGYDRRLLDVASELGFRTISPGSGYRDPFNEENAAR